MLSSGDTAGVPGYDAGGISGLCRGVKGRSKTGIKGRGGAGDGAYRHYPYEKAPHKESVQGYRQRVGFSCALLGNPEVIILDEPTVGLDPRQIIDIRSLIQSLREKHTVILSSHILSEVSAVCDHILIISKGKLVAATAPKT